MTVYDRNRKTIQCHTEMVLVDVVGFSKLSSLHQVKAAIVINGELENLINLSSGFSALDLKEVVAGFVPTGDGFYVVLQPNIVGYGVSLAISLMTALLNASERSENEGTGKLYEGIRVASHFGEVCEFSDITESDNFVGHGMNECARILGAKSGNAPKGFLKDENFIVVSEASLAAHNALFTSEEATKYFTALGLKRSPTLTLEDKHSLEHHYHFIEFSRRVIFNPPNPSNYEQRVRERLKMYMGESNEG